MKKCIINNFACFLLLLIPLMLVSMTLCQIEGAVVDYYCVADVDSDAVCVVGPLCQTVSASVEWIQKYQCWRPVNKENIKCRRQS
jgi:hypothetical protein